MKWSDKTYACSVCGSVRKPGRALCTACQNAARKERYTFDPNYRSKAKAAHNAWREAHRAERAAYMRELRARARQENHDPSNRNPGQ